MTRVLLQKLGSEHEASGLATSFHNNPGRVDIAYTCSPGDFKQGSSCTLMFYGLVLWTCFLGAM